MATTAKWFSDGGKDPAELLRFRQRKRELQLAVLLAAKLDVFAVDKDEERFLRTIERETESLCENSLGGSLLGGCKELYIALLTALLTSARFARSYCGGVPRPREVSHVLLQLLLHRRVWRDGRRHDFLLEYIIHGK